MSEENGGGYEAKRIIGYTDLLPPAGEMWRWVRDRGGSIRCQQEDPGPAYGVIDTPEGALRVDVWEWVLHRDGVFMRQPGDWPGPGRG